MATVTVFGGSGFIGRHVVSRLAKRGDQIRVAVRDPEAALFLKPMGDVGQVTPCQVNVRDTPSVRTALQGADEVINLVGILYETRRQKFDTVHVGSAGRIAQLAAAEGVKSLVHLSSIGADAVSPAHYARSKAAGEAAVRAAFPEATILRPSIVFGPHDVFFNRFAALARLPLPLPVPGCGPPRISGGRIDWFGGGGPRFQPVYVGDVADAVIASLDHPEARGEIYELGGPRIYSFLELMRLVLEETGHKRPLVPLPGFLAYVIGLAMEIFPSPPLTRDQARLLKRDNVVGKDVRTLVDLDIQPTTVEAMLPTYMDTYRRGGHYARH